MAKQIDSMLEPGEEVRYRDPRRLAPAVWLTALLGLAYGAAAGFVFEVSTWIFVSAGLFLLARTAWSVIGKLLPETLVTDRRMIEKTGWFSPQVSAIPLEEIEDFRFIPAGLPGYLIVTGPFGRVHRAFGLRRPQPFCRALARAAGLPCPPLFGRLENTAEYCVVLGGMPLTGLLFWGLYSLLLALAPAGVTAQDFAFVILALLALPVLYVGLKYGTHLAGLLSVPLLKPFVTLEEQRNWLCGEVENEDSNKKGRKIRPLYLKLAGLMWGRTLTCETCKGKVHG